MEKKKVTKIARKGKRRGQDRQSVTFGGIRKQEKSQRRRIKRHMNKELGKSGIPAIKKSKADKRMMEPPVSVLFKTIQRLGCWPRCCRRLRRGCVRI